MDRICGQSKTGARSRREVLRGFGAFAGGALAATLAPRASGAYFGAIAQAGGGTGRSFPVTTVNHLNLTSANYAKSRDFYAGVLGMRVVWDDGRQCALEFGSSSSPNGMYIRPLTKPGEKPAIGHMAFGIPNFMAQRTAMKAELDRRAIRNVRADGEVGWSCDDPAGYPLNVWVPEKDKAMFPGAAGPCEIAASEKCKAAWEKGQKNLKREAEPNGGNFRPIGYSFILLNVPEIERERNFYHDLLGMKLIYEKPGSECLLQFGENTLWLRKNERPGEKPYCNHFGVTIENYDSDRVESELKRRGLKPVANSKLSWSVADPDGYRLDISAPGFAEHIAKDCQGSSATCPGGSAG